MLTDIASFPFLRAIWQEHIRSGLRKHTFRDFYLAQDAVQFGAYEWGLEPFLNRLVEDLRSATYSPEPADVFRGAKGTGLSRPLAYLAPRDALLYRAIVAKAESDLTRDLRPWTGAHLTDKKAGEQSEVDRGESEEYADWFAIWLRRQGIIADICERCEFVVESDVSNFFGSVDLNVLQEYLLHKTSLHRDVVRLVIHLIRRVLRHPEYADSPSLGLPQESFGASRTIAHGLLCEVDSAFDVEGGDGIYSRFMDDFVAGVNEPTKGEELISRLQRKLERLGLYPNPAKTRVVPVPKYLIGAMAEENVFLDSIEAMLEPLEEGKLREIVGVPAVIVDELREHANLFRAIDSEIRPKWYNRVQRRYYALFKRLGIDDWIPSVYEDLAAHPDSGREILEYARSFPITAEAVEQLFASICNHRSCYDDLPLLEIETLATAPNNNSQELRRAIVDSADSLAKELEIDSKTPRSLSDWMLAALVPLIGKFATRGQQEEFIDKYIERKPAQCMARLQALPLQVSHGRNSTEMFHAQLAGLPWSSVLTIDFVRALEGKDDSALGVAMNLLQPKICLSPNRFQIHSRPLLLCGLLARVGGARFSNSMASAVNLLRENPQRLIDDRLIELIAEYKS